MQASVDAQDDRSEVVLSALGEIGKATLGAFIDNAVICEVYSKLLIYIE